MSSPDFFPGEGAGAGDDLTVNTQCAFASRYVPYQIRVHIEHVNKWCLSVIKESPG